MNDLLIPHVADRLWLFVNAKENARQLTRAVNDAQEIGGRMDRLHKRGHTTAMFQENIRMRTLREKTIQCPREEPNRRLIELTSNVC